MDCAMHWIPKRGIKVLGSWFRVLGGNLRRYANLMSGYRDLLVWEKAKMLAVKIYRHTNEGKFAYDFGFRDQIRRAGVSIASNIAEGAERNTNKDSIRFFTLPKVLRLRYQLKQKLRLKLDT